MQRGNRHSLRKDGICMARQVTIVGIGMGNPDTMTLRARRALESCDCLIGAGRMLESIPFGPKERLAQFSPQPIVRFLQEHLQFEHICVAMSGDVGFYSGAKKLAEALGEEFQVEFEPGISSLSYFCAKCATSWDDVLTVSVHGRAAQVTGPVRHHKKVFFITGNTHTAAQICRQLTQAGLGDCRVSVGENLSYACERIVHGTARELMGQEFSPLSVVLVENPHWQRRQVVPGIPDEEFLRDKVPMTKFEVRCASVSLLGVRDGDILYDIGAGTGSVSVELARCCPMGSVYAIEKKPEAIALLEKNRERFGVENLVIVPGEAPEALLELPAPDRAFIGGSSGNLSEIFEALLRKNPGIHLVVSAVTLETLTQATQCVQRYSMREVQISQVTAARARRVGNYHMMTGQNPVWLICARGNGEELPC